MEKANVYALVTGLPIALLLAVVYAALWGLDGLFSPLVSPGFFVALGSLILGIVAHEAIHGLSWAVFGRKPLRSVEFGFQVRTLTPYAHCKEPIPARAYRLGTAMPGVLLGLAPSLFGLLTGSGPAMLFGLFFTFAAGGDALILWLLRGVDPDALVEEHPLP
jgi:hypothetical protein